MELKEEFTTACVRWRLLTFYQKFEHAVILVLSGLISIVVALAVWNLVLKLSPASCFRAVSIRPTIRSFRHFSG
jgi:hypothetical protein